MGPRVHFHSDAPFFAGCENMLVNFFNDNHFMGAYDVSFSYRYSLEYEQEFRERVTGSIRTYPLAIADTGWLSNSANKLSFKPFAIIVKIFVQFLKCFFIAYNTVILFGFFRKLKIDLLHINNGGYPGAYSCMSAVFAAKLAGIRRLVYVVNNVAYSYRSPGRWADYFPDKLVKRIVSVFVTGSIYAGEELKKVLALPQDKVKSIKNGVSLRPVTEDRGSFIQRLQLPKDRLLIGVAAVLEERKGHLYLLQAIKSLKEKGLKNKIPYTVIAGKGVLLEPLERYVRDENLGDDVKFIGVEKNISNLMNAIDLLVLPSIAQEDFPYVVLEAMGFGRPVIASSICGIPEQIENMKSGLLLEPKDTEGLAEAINYFLENRSSLKLFGDYARQVFNEKFLAPLAVRHYGDLYKGLLGGGD